MKKNDNQFDHRLISGVIFIHMKISFTLQKEFVGISKCVGMYLVETRICHPMSSIDGSIDVQEK